MKIRLEGSRLRPLYVRTAIPAFGVYVSNIVESVKAGPADVLATTGDKEVISTNATGSRLVRQNYVDGSVYQLQIPKGSPFHPHMSLLDEVPPGVWMDAFNPRDIGDEEDQHYYIAIWVPNR